MSVKHPNAPDVTQTALSHFVVSDAIIIIFK